jgi:hypothetical protein
MRSIEFQHGKAESFAYETWAEAAANVAGDSANVLNGVAIGSRSIIVL